MPLLLGTYNSSPGARRWQPDSGCMSPPTCPPGRVDLCRAPPVHPWVVVLPHWGVAGAVAGRSAGVRSGRRATLTMGLRLLLPGLSHQSRDCYLWPPHLLFQFTLCPIARVIFVKCKSCVIYLFKVLYRQCFLAWHEALLEIPPGFCPWASFFIPAKKRGCSIQWLRAGTWSPKVPELLEIIWALPLADDDLGK